MSCPIHQTQFTSHEKWRINRFHHEGLPVKDEYDHYQCNQCLLDHKEWVIIDNSFYHYSDGKWNLIRKLPEHPRKGKYIGARVYQP